jgi:hypothetical protein
MSILSTRDTSFNRYWFLTIDDNVLKKYTTRYNYVLSLIKQMLTSEFGWKKLGYTFKQINQKDGIKLRNQHTRSTPWKKYIFHIRLSSNKFIKKTCGFSGLSCADMLENVIFLNDINWVYGTRESGMSPLNLRYYCINHEIGHLLGRYHKKCTYNSDCSIMLQQTIKKDSCNCFPNIFPLQDD